MTLFGNKIIAYLISQEEVILEYSGPLIQYDSCPNKKNTMWKIRHIHREKAVWELESSYYKSKCYEKLGQKPETVPLLQRENGPTNTFISDF